MNKFSVGEIAIVNSPVRHPDCIGYIANGEEVTLLEYDPSDDTWKTDRIDKNGKPIWGKTRYLRKRPQQDDQLFTKWFNETILPYSTVEPLEETMRRVHPSLGEINRHGS